MKNLNNYLKDKKINYNKLEDFGFNQIDNKYIYEKQLSDEDFKLIIEIEDNNMTSKVMDLNNDEEYLPIDVESSTGAFVGKIRKECDDTIKKVVDKCLDNDIFKGDISINLINYIKEKYGDDLEYLWKKFPKTAIARNKNNDKWYILFATIALNKIGINSDEEVEIIDIKNNDNIVDNKLIFKGYHMNKDNWITIKLDNTMPIEEIYNLIDKSYEIVENNQ